MYWLYNLVLVCTLPLWLPWMLRRSSKRKGKPDRQERMGNYSFSFDKDKPHIWLHAVSVGEAAAAVPILKAIRSISPESQILVTTTTTSGHETAGKLILDQGLCCRVAYFPIDIAAYMLTAVFRVRPDAAAIMETELWFNFLWACKIVKANTLLVNGRISDRSFRRSKHIAFFYRALFKKVDEALFQTEGDAARARQLGCATPEVIGNSKYDEAIAGAQGDRSAIRIKYGLQPEDKVIVVGSTRGEEEQAFVVDALKQVPGEWKVIHAPRHLETADSLEALYKGAFGECARRSRGETGRILILDTYGELGEAYLAGDISVIGGGFQPFGGQNLIQGLAAGLPVLRGPNFQNFREAAALAEEHGASITVETPQELARSISELLTDEQKRAQMSQAAKQSLESSAGASMRYAERIVKAANEAFAERQSLFARKPGT